jgi:integrase
VVRSETGTSALRRPHTWKSNVVDLRPSTFARDEGYLNRYILPVFGEMPIGDLSVGLIRKWVSDLNASGLAPATVVKAEQILTKILRSAVEEGVINTNPTSNVRLPRLERHEMRNLSPVEVSRLADAIHPRYRAVIFLGAYGGLRAGELFGLRVGRLDMAAQRVEAPGASMRASTAWHQGLSTNASIASWSSIVRVQQNDVTLQERTGPSGSRSPIPFFSGSG